LLFADLSGKNSNGHKKNRLIFIWFYFRLLIFYSLILIILIIYTIYYFIIRIGGSALTTVYNQIGDDAADVDDVQALKSLFEVVQVLVKDELILSGHDR
jgi:hypothetical protein